MSIRSILFTSFVHFLLFSNSFTLKREYVELDDINSITYFVIVRINKFDCQRLVGFHVTLFFLRGFNYPTNGSERSLAFAHSDWNLQRVGR